MFVLCIVFSGATVPTLLTRAKPFHSRDVLSKAEEDENHKLHCGKIAVFIDKLSRFHSRTQQEITQKRPTQLPLSWEACSWTGGCSSVWTWVGPYVGIQGPWLWGELCWQSSLLIWPPNSYFCCLSCNGTE